MMYFIALGALIVVAAFFFIWQKRKSDAEYDDDYDEPTFGLATKTATAVQEETKADSGPGGKDGGPLAIFFGSQTGTAESFANTLVGEGCHNRFDAKSLDLEDFDPEEFVQLEHTMFMMATYGEGDPTDNSAEFMDWLKEKVDEGDNSTLLSGMKVSVFALGNRQYEHFNKAGKDCQELLTKLGAETVYAMGEGDDDGTLEDDFMAWKENLWPTLRQKFLGEDPATSSSAAGTTELPAPAVLSFDFNTVPNPLLAMEEAEYDLDAPAASTGKGDNVAARRQLLQRRQRAETLSGDRRFSTCRQAKVMVNRELRADTSDGNTFHMELDCKHSGLEYNMADNLGIYAQNPPDVVEAVLRWMGYDGDAWLHCVAREGVDKTPPFPTPCTVRTAFSEFVELLSSPRRGLLAGLCHYASKESEKQRLALLASPKGKDEFNEWVVGAGRTTQELLQEFPSLRVPAGDLLQLLPPMQPRYYTISSSPKQHPNRVHLTVVVVADARKDDTVRPGVCTHHLKGLFPPSLGGDGKRTDGNSQGKKGEGRPVWPTVYAFVRPSAFVLPADPLTPVVMVGPGTGIAPMRAILQERQWQQEQGMKTGPTVLFFGCRHAAKDFIYEDELLSASQGGVLTHLYTAFSRDQAEKVYVQHLLAQQAHQVWQWMHDQRGVMYVCGATGMGRDVLAALEGVASAQQGGGQSADDAAKFVKECQSGGRYISELWG